MIADVIWYVVWERVYGLVTFDEKKNPINTSRIEMFSYTLVYFFSLVVFFCKVGPT